MPISFESEGIRFGEVVSFSYGSICVGILLLLLQLWAIRIYLWLKPPRIPGVPYVEDTSLLGFTEQVGNPKMHELVLKRSKSFNSQLYQIRLLGHRLLIISDKNLARIAAKGVVGKGDPFHKLLLQRFANGQAVSSTFSLDTNDEWQMRRSKFRHPFSLAALKHFDGDIQALVDKMGGIIGAAADSGAPLRIDRLFGQFTMDVICRLGFKYDLGALDSSAAYTDIHSALTTALRLVFLPILVPGIAYMRWVPLKTIQMYFNANDTVSKFGEMLYAHLQHMHARGELPEDSYGRALLEFAEMPGVQEEHARAEIVLAFIAGHETTAHSLSWVVYSLCKHPEVQRKAQAAMDAHTGDNVLPDYVEALVKESMRKYPVAQGNLRRVTQPEGFDIGGVHLKQGDWTVINSFVVHNLASNWGEDVDEFKPERFLGEDNPLASAAIYGGGGDTKDSLSFFPFSHGPRNCLGMNLALIEIRFAVAHIIKNYSFSFVDESMQDERVALLRTLTLLPKDELPVYVQHRNK